VLLSLREVDHLSILLGRKLAASDCKHYTYASTRRETRLLDYTLIDHFERTIFDVGNIPWGDLVYCCIDRYPKL
jgi:hypothetical protein